MPRVLSRLTAIVGVGFAVLGTTAIAAQDKYALRTASWVAFADFRGYEGWEVVSVARTEEVLKVIVANPTMIGAYKAGVPGNGGPFPDGSKIAKLQWNPKKSTEAPFVVDVPDTFAQAFFMEGQREIPGQRRLGVRAVQPRSRVRHVHRRSQPVGLRARVPRGREGEGPHLPPVPEAVTRGQRRAR